MPSLRILSQSDVERALTMADAIAAVESAYVQLSTGRVEMPVRIQVPVPEHGGVSLFMPAYSPAFPVTTVKTVSVYPGNREKALPAIMGAVLVLDSRTGAPVALLEASHLTAVRTGAATGVACRHLARPDAHTAAVIGAGGQAREQVRAILATTGVREVRIAARSQASAAALAGALANAGWTNREGQPVQFTAAPDARAAVAGAQIVVTATTSSTPVIRGSDLAPGTLVAAIGAFRPEMQEVGPDTLGRCSRIVVDSRQAVQHEDGSLIAAVARGLLTWDAITAEIGQVAAGAVAGRAAPEEIIYFKSCGLAIQDLAAAATAVARAEAAGIGTVVEF